MFLPVCAWISHYQVLRTQMREVLKSFFKFLKLVIDTGYFKEIYSAFRIERGPVLDEEFKLLDLPILKK